ncbi:T9SS type A sorting domain-containing protein [Flavobacterium sp. KACC 22761]|uniref:T9SS type A sorting domain-containing protein n=1 Tax=Flavobacterium sp. KACC 22761 TaxID=3092665 RepID=UPI002A75CC53|nr:T9SS type A sorting domain-containing protein [Flavobacterium sp. KACC 22761]WPO78027.1 T9SS type A sorting domain-containing protein [Flavobacterium sp. KACC 22761]
MKNVYLIIICSFISTFSYAQTPGGVTGSQAWFKSNRLANGNFNWIDFSGDQTKLNNWNTKNEYSNIGRYFNFNPGLYFDGNSREFFLNQTNLQQGTIIGIFGHSTTYFNYENTLFGIKGRTDEGTIITNDKIANSAERDGETLDYGSQFGEDLFRKADNSEGTDAKYRERALKIVSYYQYQQPHTSVWGEDQTSSLTLGYAYLNRANGLSTYDLKNFNNNFYGYIPEILVYSRVLTPLERRKAETYLAIKYGVSLSNSYISSDDKLLWDFSANTAYNNRISGIMRDDLSALNQPFSTTSYEESPYFSDAYDSYVEQTYHDQTSRYRLLVMGQSPANDLADKNATLWGDDNGALTTKNEGGIAGIKRMTRTWKLVTNTPPPTSEQKILLFNNNGLETDSGFGQCTFTNKTANTTGISVTQTPLQGKNGYLEFITAATGSTLIIKFGAKDGLPSSQDFGVKIDPSGYIYILENTKQPLYIGWVTPNFNKTTLEKKGDQVYLNIYDSNGAKVITSRTLPVLPTDIDKPFYGIVSIERKTADAYLKVVHGGFVATGSKVELSYDASRAAEFATNTDRSFLIIDRSGTGDFGVENVEYYPVSEIDASRKKIIFNNVIWDADGNGKDVFSFGYKDASVRLIALEEGVNPTCQDGVLQENGKINIEVKEGLPGYKYTLNKTGTTTVVQTGTFYESKNTLTGIPAGNYDLTLEMVGTNFEKTGGTTAVASCSNTPMTTGGNGTLEWAVTDFTSDKYIGFISQKTTKTTAVLNYGVQIKQNQLYFWNKGVASGNALATLNKGNRIKLNMQSGTLQCWVDDNLVGTQNLAMADVSSAYYAFVLMEGSSNGIYNLVHTGLVTSPAKLVWTTATNLNIIEGDGVTSKVVQKIELIAPECKEIVPPITPVITDNLVVAPVPSKAGANFNIYVKLNNPSEVMVLIFNSAGALINQLRNAEPQLTNTFVTSIPTNGIYIIKVLTAEGEFSKSIIIN